ncbi:MAG: hypothetical protein ABI551_15930 [Polyangiaceae bacterium]
MKLRTLALASLVLGSAACSGGFGTLRSTSLIVVTIQSGDVGSPQNRLPLPLTTPASFTVRVEAHRPDGSLDTSFDGVLRMSVKPGTIATTTQRQVQLKNGVADGVQLDVLASFGNSRIWAEDLGYLPVDPNGPKKPQCSDGIDNNGNSKIDFPNDPGCYSAIDDSEDTGSYATGTSSPIFFQLPRIADVRGVSTGGAATTFPNEQVQMDTGYDPSTNSFSHSLIVTRISPSGFFVTDIDDPRGFNSVMAFNFSAPPLLRVCDRLRGFAGTASDFFGFTEINYPAWETDEWEPSIPGERPCLVPDPQILKTTDIANNQGLFRYESGLVRLITDGTLAIHVSSHFGPDLPQGPGFTPTDTATNCDLNNDGRVNFTSGDEQTCSKACDADVECTEYSNFKQRSGFYLTVTDTAANPTAVKIQVDASQAASTVDPPTLRGKPVKAFTGSLTYFSGGSQFTIEARCSDDVILDQSASPLPMDQACVQPRTISDNNAGSN